MHMYPSVSKLFLNGHKFLHLLYHYIRARGLGGDGPKDIISSVSAEFVVALRHNRVSKPKTEKLSLAE